MTRRFRTLLLGFGVAAPLWLHAQTTAQLQQDFDAAWRAAADRYAYFDAKATTWAPISCWRRCVRNGCKL